jgi:hypothetical protein
LFFEGELLLGEWVAVAWVPQQEYEEKGALVEGPDGAEDVDGVFSRHVPS